MIYSENSIYNTKLYLQYKYLSELLALAYLFALQYVFLITEGGAWIIFKLKPEKSQEKVAETLINTGFSLNFVLRFFTNIYII